MPTYYEIKNKFFTFDALLLAVVVFRVLSNWIIFLLLSIHSFGSCLKIGLNYPTKSIIWWYFVQNVLNILGFSESVISFHFVCLAVPLRITVTKIQPRLTNPVGAKFHTINNTKWFLFKLINLLNTYFKFIIELNI